jgi:hypothetical protein
VAVQCYADTFVVIESLVLRINPESIRDGKIATFAKPENVGGKCDGQNKQLK